MPGNLRAAAGSSRPSDSDVQLIASRHPTGTTHLAFFCCKIALGALGRHVKLPQSTSAFFANIFGHATANAPGRTQGRSPNFGRNSGILCAMFFFGARVGMRRTSARLLDFSDTLNHFLFPALSWSPVWIAAAQNMASDDAAKAMFIAQQEMEYRVELFNRSGVTFLPPVCYIFALYASLSACADCPSRFAWRRCVYDTDAIFAPHAGLAANSLAGWCQPASRSALTRSE